jgi:ribokinase
MAKIVVIGSLNMDLVARAPKIPIPGETVLGSTFNTFPGGKGANQAVSAARQGAEVVFVGRVGADAFGRQLVEGLRVEGIDTQSIGITETTSSGVALITVDAAGQNNIVIVPGANHQLTPEDIEQASLAFEQADALLLQLEIPLETVQAAARQAKKQGVKVILNPAPAQALPADLLSLVDVIVLNESESALLSGLPVETLEQAETATCALIKQGLGCVVLTLGANGALLLTNAQPAIYEPGFPVEVVDTTSAGDAFTGAFAVALAAGLPPEKALRRGCAAGSLAVTRPGAQPSIPTAAEVDQFLVSGQP